MRIALLTSQFPGARSGGIGTYTLQAARALVEAGHETHLFTLALPADVRGKVPAGVQLHEVADLATTVAEGKLPGAAMTAIYTAGGGGDAMYRLANAWRFYEAIAALHERTPLDVIEAPEYEALGLPLASSRLVGVALIVQLHSGSVINRLGNDVSAGPGDALIDAFEAAAIIAADGICAPTRAVMNATGRALFDIAGGLPTAPRQAVVPLPFRAADPAVKWTPPAANGAVLFVGRLERLKGVDLLAEAAGEFLASFPDATLELAGTDTPTAPAGGSMQTHLQSIIPAAVRGRVKFLGELPPETVRDAMARSALVVIPSRYENYSQVACEAMAAGRAVIVASDTGPAEFVGNAGVTFQRGDDKSLASTLVKLYGDKTRLATLGQAGFIKMRTELSAQQAIAERVAFYKQTVANARDASGKRRATSKLELATSCRATLEFCAQRLENLPARHVAELLRSLATLDRALTGEALPLATPGSRLLVIFESLGTGSQVLLFGAGRHTTRLLSECALWQSGLSFPQRIRPRCPLRPQHMPALSEALICPLCRQRIICLLCPQRIICRPLCALRRAAPSRGGARRRGP